MREYKANIQIEAAPQAVWDVLVDTARWPEWDPNCVRIEGNVALGDKVKVFTKLSPGRAFPVKVVELDAPRQMTWLGGMPLGLFKGVRTYTLESNAGGTHFVMHERFSGPMLALIGRTIPDMTDAFNAFVEGLKRQAEQAESA